MPESCFVRQWRRISLFPLTLVVSLVVHLLILFGPSWSLPVEEEPIRIEARLNLPPVQPVSTKAQKPVRSGKAEKPSHPGSSQQVLARPSTPPGEAGGASVAAQADLAQAESSAEPDGNAPDPATSEPVAESDPSPVSKQPGATQAWPREGQIRYQVRYGEALAVGELVMSWSHDGERYTMRAEANSSGLVRLFKRYTATQQSQGRVGPEGLAPSGFQEDLNGKQSHAVFDWKGGKVVASRPDRTREYPIVGIAQDILSLAHHLAFQPETAERVHLLVVTGRWATEVELSQVANEVLRVPWGRMVTRHFHCEAKKGDFGIDIWLDREHHNVPIRIRVDDRKQGHVVDQIAREMNLDGVQIKFKFLPPQQETYDRS